MRVLFAALALGTLAIAPAGADSLRTFSSQGLPGSEGVVLRLSHPATWKKVAVDDEMVLAELRGPQGRLTGILQIGRGRQGQDTQALCRPERARTMLADIAAREPGTRVTDLFARTLAGRPAYELRYERSDASTLMRVRSVIVCLKDSRVLVSCGGAGTRKADLPEIDAVCSQVLDSLTISED